MIACWPSGYGIRLEGSRPGFDFHFVHGEFPGLSHTRNLKLITPVETQPEAWHHRVSAGTGWPGVSMLGLGEIENLISKFCCMLSVRGQWYVYRLFVISQRTVVCV